ncbi:MAG: CooT family nickel-binding protein [bacterium]
MCASTAYYRRGAEEEVLLTDVMHLIPLGDGYRLVGLLGDDKVLERARLVEVDFESHRIVLGPCE